MIRRNLRLNVETNKGKSLAWSSGIEHAGPVKATDCSGGRPAQECHVPYRLSCWQDPPIFRSSNMRLILDHARRPPKRLSSRDRQKEISAVSAPCPAPLTIVSSPGSLTVHGRTC